MSGSGCDFWGMEFLFGCVLRSCGGVRGMDCSANQRPNVARAVSVSTEGVLFGPELLVSGPDPDMNLSRPGGRHICEGSRCRGQGVIFGVWNFCLDVF